MTGKLFQGKPLWLALERMWLATGIGLWTLGIVNTILQIVRSYFFRVLESFQRADKFIAGLILYPYKLCSSLRHIHLGHGVPLQ